MFYVYGGTDGPFLGSTELVFHIVRKKIVHMNRFNGLYYGDIQRLVSRVITLDKGV